jgi:hypothetical protein
MFSDGIDGVSIAETQKTINSFLGLQVHKRSGI